MTAITKTDLKLPKIGEPQIELLERLCNANAVSGDEGEVRKIVLEQVRAVLENRPGEVKTDALGNVLVTLPGQGEEQDRLRVMLDAHMDEVGFMITNDEEKGIYRFDTVGGIDLRYLVGKPVLIGHDHIPGVIGAKPIHLTKPEETRNALTLDTLRVDVGPGGDKVKVGDRATFATRFKRVGAGFRAKALDDRIGVATLIELIKNTPPNIDLLAAFTVQEEVGLRGARVAAYTLNPDLAIAIDSTPAYDLPAFDAEPDEPETSYNTRLGAGPALYIADSATLSDPRLIRHFMETAEAYGIEYQVRQPGGGGTNAGSIQLQRGGIPSMSISVPGRYHHSPMAISRLSDWQNTLSLVYAALSNLSAGILSVDRA